jgi:hypothetical protein
MVSPNSTRNELSREVSSPNLPRSSTVALCTASSIVGNIAFFAEIVAISQGPASIVFPLVASSPLVVVLLAYGFLKERLTRDPANMLTMTHVPNVVSTSHPLVGSLERSVRSVTGRPPKVTSFWGWTDAALMTHFAKMPSVVFGPGGAGAHARIEYVITEDLVRCTHVYSQVALDICGASS